MPGNGEQFGWIDFEDSPYVSRNKKSGWATGINLHLLSGPISAPLPPRLWDFMLGYQRRDTFEDRFSYDMAFNVGVYSDFEDSARDGVRYVGHAVGMAHASDAVDWVLGVDYLDRDDYRILPVCGLSLHPDSSPRWQFDAIFPRPRAQYALNGAQRLYVSGNLGGGTWDIEMPGEVNDVMTYRDFRLLFGHERLTDRGVLSAFELGYVFGRKLELREAANRFDFDDAFVLRFVTRR
jgi:hypothetical protein